VGGLGVFSAFSLRHHLRLQKHLEESKGKNLSLQFFLSTLEKNLFLLLLLLRLQRDILHQEQVLVKD